VRGAVVLAVALAATATAQQKPPAPAAQPVQPPQPAPPPAAPPQKKPPEGWKVEPFKLSNAAAGFEVGLAGYMQADFRSYLDWQVGDGSDPTLRAEETEWRRLRIGFEGEWRRLSFEFDVDPAFDEGDELKDARLGLRLAKALRVDGGHIKLPMSPEWLSSASKTDFIERAAVVGSLAPGRDWGGLLQGGLGKAAEWSAGVFAGDTRSGSSRAGTTAAARLVLRPAGWLDLGGSFAQGDVAADAAVAGVEPSPKGLDGTSGTGYRFFPAAHVNGQRRRWGAEARIQGGPVAVWGEFLEAREERLGQGPVGEDLPDVRGRGLSATATWLVTGERKARTIRPARTLFRGPGAVELSVRYEELWFDDVSNQGFEAAGSRARNIRPAGIQTLTGGLSWWPTRFLRLQGNVLVERYDDALRAPEPGRRGDYVSILSRIQVHLP
jgi:phosphate-selective porin